MSKTVVSSDNAPAAIGPYSPGIQTGNMVFLSGQLGIDPATGKLPEGVEAQAKPVSYTHLTLPTNSRV